MHVCLPALATAGLFAAVILLDFINKDFRLIMGHSLLAFISVLLVLYLCQRDAEMVAWALLITPFILIFLGWSIGALSAASGKTQPSQQAQASSQDQPAFYGYGACISCEGYPCTCKQASVEVPKKTTDASGNDVVLCGANTNKPQCLDVSGLPSA